MYRPSQTVARSRALSLSHRKACRICGSAALSEVIDLGAQYLQGAFLKPDHVVPPLQRIPTGLVRCDPTRDGNACGLLQMKVTVPPETLYSSYWYRSGTNGTMRGHLAGIAREAVAMTGADTAVALDIGCNDGTLLRAYPRAVRKFGVDPSDITEESRGEFEVVRDFFPSPALSRRLGGRRCDIVTTIAMFYDLERPLEFVRAVKSVLGPRGIWVMEMSYMPSMLALNAYDTICHEHLEYYSFAVIERLVGMAGMKVVRAGLNDINGGSIRCHVVHDDCSAYDDDTAWRVMAGLRAREAALGLDTDAPYRFFQQRVDKHRRDLGGLLKDLKRAGKSVHVYGASTKGNTILQWCGIDRTVVPFAADRNPAKFGARTIGTDIAIVSEEESRAMKPDYYLVLPWHFRAEFLAREAAMLAAGTKFIFPLPEIEIVGA